MTKRLLLAAVVVLTVVRFWMAGHTELLPEEAYYWTYAKHPALLRMLELEALGELARNGNARIYIGFDKHAALEGESRAEEPAKRG